MLDIRDTLTDLLSNENKDIFDKFKNNEEYSFEEAQSDYRKKTAEKDNQKDQLDLTNRLFELDRLYSLISTLPIPQIISNAEKKDEFKKKLQELKKVVETMSTIFEGL